MRRLMFLSPLVLALSCETGVESGGDPGPTPPSLYLLSETNADSIDIAFRWYNSILVTHMTGYYLLSRDFRSVGVGTKDSSGYAEVWRSETRYDTALSAFAFQLNAALVLDYYGTATRLTIRYYRQEAAFVDVDTVVRQYAFPYERAEILVTGSIIPQAQPVSFQDFDRRGNKIYYHPVGGYALYEYDLVSGATRNLGYYHGDHVAVDSTFIFYNVGPVEVWRYDLSTDTKKELLIGSGDIYSGVAGIEALDGVLYVLDGGTSRLVRYTYDGDPIDTVACTDVAWHIAIDDGILYLGHYLRKIRRIELATMTELPSVASPADNLEGIRILDGRLYYCDYRRRLIGSVPLEDLRPPLSPYPSSPANRSGSVP